jgi:hypothetical protein
MAVPSTSSGSSLLAPKCGRTWDNGISLSDTAAVVARKAKADKKPQSQRFIETARELGCDEDEAAFDEKLKRIATVKPKSRRASKPATGGERARRSRKSPG